jgi:hypothetical protein
VVTTNLPDMLSIAEPYVGSARLAADLVRAPVVAERWDAESECAGMTVGGLARHLAAQWGNAVRLLSAAPDDQPPISVAEHYSRAAWVTAGVDDDANATIRDAANREASEGRERLLAQVDDDLAALPGVLAAAAHRRPDAVLIPWQGWSLTAHDFLVTRLMEIVVHSDDLAASIGLPTPQFSDDAVREVLGLLTTVAVGRHGQTAVVRSLTRPQRLAGPVTAF